MPENESIEGLPMLDGEGEDKPGWDMRKWLSWRSASENRTAWKLLSTVCLCAYATLYFHWVVGSVALCICGLIFFLKLLVEIWGQETPTWACPGSPCMFIVMYVLGWPYFLSTLGYCTKTSDIEFPYRDVIAVMLNVFGSVYSLGYEVHRFRWKAQSENKGKLYTAGLGKLCMHPNYFGDLFTYSGWALATGTIYAFNLVLTSVWALTVFVIPNSQEYLAKRYPDEFFDYEKSTAKFIPFIYSDLLLKVLAWTSLAGALCCSMDTKACGF